MDVPDEIVKRLSDTPKEKQAEEGINICVESIERTGLFPRPEIE